MPPATGVVVAMLSVLLSVNHAEPSSCDTSCLSQAGVPCDIITSAEDCPKRPPASGPEYPGLPDNVKVTYYMEDTTPRLNVTWSTPQTGLDYVKAFEIKYHSYIDNPDLDDTKGPDGEFGFCVQYNMSRGIHPEPEAQFYHDCVNPTHHYLTLTSLPQKDQDHDYEHRVMAMFKQDFEHTAHWQPPLVIIHNDSCEHTVEVELYLAPADFKFEHYRVALRYADDRINDADRKDFTVVPGKETHSVTFSDVENDLYVIKVYPEPNDRGDLCNCPNCGEAGCFSSKTGAFIINDSHPKCMSEAAPEDSTPGESVPQSLTLMIILLVLCIFFIMVFVAIFVAFYKGRDKIEKDKLESPQDINDNISEVPCVRPQPASLFDFGNSSLMEWLNDNQSNGRHCVVNPTSCTDMDTLSENHGIQEGEALPMRDTNQLETNHSANPSSLRDSTSDSRNRDAPDLLPTETGSVDSLEYTTERRQALMTYLQSDLDSNRSESPNFDIIPPTDVCEIHRSISICGSYNPDGLSQNRATMRSYQSPDSGIHTAHRSTDIGVSQSDMANQKIPRGIPTGRKWPASDIATQGEYF